MQSVLFCLINLYLCLKNIKKRCFVHFFLFLCVLSSSKIVLFLFLLFLSLYLHFIHNFLNNFINILYEILLIIYVLIFDNMILIINSNTFCMLPHSFLHNSSFETNNNNNKDVANLLEISWQSVFASLQRKGMNPKVLNFFKIVLFLC